MELRLFVPIYRGNSWWGKTRAGGVVLFIGMVTRCIWSLFILRVPFIVDIDEYYLSFLLLLPCWYSVLFVGATVFVTFVYFLCSLHFRHISLYSVRCLLFVFFTFLGYLHSKFHYWCSTFCILPHPAILDIVDSVPGTFQYDSGRNVPSCDWSRMRWTQVLLSFPFASLGIIFCAGDCSFFLRPVGSCLSATLVHFCLFTFHLTIVLVVSDIFCYSFVIVHSVTVICLLGVFRYRPSTWVLMPLLFIHLLNYWKFLRCATTLLHSTVYVLFVIILHSVTLPIYSFSFQIILLIVSFTILCSDCSLFGIAVSSFCAIVVLFVQWPGVCGRHWSYMTIVLLFLSAIHTVLQWHLFLLLTF